MKRILVIARYNQIEAMRVAAGLTLLDNRVRVDVIGRIGNEPEIQEQKDVLDFADVPCVMLDGPEAATVASLAEDIVAADVVYRL